MSSHSHAGADRHQSVGRRDEQKTTNDEMGMAGELPMGFRGDEWGWYVY